MASSVLAFQRKARGRLRLPFEQTAYIHPQRLVAVGGGRRLNLYCSGSGKPPVILEGGPAGGWDQVGGRVSSRRETERRRTCCARRPPDRSSPHRLDLILRTHYSVPLLVDRLYKRGRQPGSPRPRAGSSNPSLSSGESVANSVFAKARRRAPPSPCRCPNLGRSTSPLNKPLHAGRTPGRSQNVLFE